MPKVPTLEGQQVQTSAFPNAKMNVNTSVETFGGGKVADANFGVVETINKIAQEEKKKANEVATTEAFSKLNQKKQELIYDPKAGALTRKGKNALGINQEYGEQFDKYADEIEGGLADEEQKAVFRKMRLRERDEFSGLLNRHTFGETQQYEKEVFDGASSALRSDAMNNYHDEKLLTDKLNLQRGLLEQRADALGLKDDPNGDPNSKAARTAFINSELSKTHASVIHTMLNNDLDQKANAYFKAVGDELTPEARQDLAKTLDAGSLRGESQRASDGIIKKYQDPVAALEAAREIDDPKLRDETVNRVKGYFSDKKAAVNLQQEQMYTDATNIVDKYRKELGSNAYDKIPSWMISKLSLSERKNLQSYAKNEPEETDLARYYDLKKLAIYDPAKFKGENLNRYKHEIARADLKQLMDLQTDMVKGNGSADQKLDGYRTEEQIVNGALKAAGITDEEKANKFRRAVESEQMAFQRAQNRPINNEEMQKIVDGQLIKHVTSKGMFQFLDTKKPTYMLDEDVPEEDRRKIIEALQNKKIKATPALIWEAYKRKKGSK